MATDAVLYTQSHTAHKHTLGTQAYRSRTDQPTSTTPKVEPTVAKDAYTTAPIAPAETRPKTPPVARKDKPVPPAPPLTIVDSLRKVSYKRTGFLGEGGFARVYEVIDEEGTRKAVKVVNKDSIRTKKNKTKLWAEIKLHQTLKHKHIVRFDDCFEDAENVYMVLELCDNGSLMDLLRRRRQYTEPEARYFLVQLLYACEHMHNNNIIHRDLKLGNLFLDGDMNIKVGDFGLAALIENEGERKKTICGTPNYIAPEVLFDTANGHSFEVDIWSVGVILYTLLIGKPPFQTKDVKAIYRRIRQNSYEFPSDKKISQSAMDLIGSILNPNPDERPTLSQILRHPWFMDGPFPPYIPASANDGPPDWSHLSEGDSKLNFDRCRRRATGAKKVVTPPSQTPSRNSQLGPSILAQERDFNNAVQPDSPISALLSSARQPLVQAPAQIKEPSLLRKLSAAGAHATLSPVRRSMASSSRPQRPGAGPPPPGSRRPAVAGIAEEEEEEHGTDSHTVVAASAGGDKAVGRDRELAAQKARIVSQMAGMRISSQDSDRENKIPHRRSATSVGSSKAPLGETHVPQSRHHERQPSSSSSKDAYKEVREHHKEIPRATPSVSTREPSLCTMVERNLDAAFTAANEGGFSTPDIDLEPPAPRIFVVSWLDYTNKYGMGFVMCDGTVSVHFVDSSSISMSPNKQRFDHLSAPSSSTPQERRNYPIDGYPADIKGLELKVSLLHHFESYMISRLFGEQPYTYVDDHLLTGMVYVKRYLRMKHVILFELSNRVLQFNFYDHTKIMLSSDGLVVTVLDKHRQLFTYSLAALLAPVAEGTDPKERKRLESVLHKVEYVKGVLARVCTHSSSKTTKSSTRNGAAEPIDSSTSTKVSTATSTATTESAPQRERPRNTYWREHDDVEHEREPARNYERERLDRELEKERERGTRHRDRDRERVREAPRVIR